MVQILTESGIAFISGSVGRGGNNFPIDVMVVQTMLNADLPTGVAVLSLNGLPDPATIAAIEAYQRQRLKSNRPDGRVDPGGQTIQALSKGLFVKPAPAPTPSPTHAPDSSKVYTDNPNEVPVKTTTPTPKMVVDMLLANWPGIVENGARTLTAQCMFETGDGRSCYNWNLGNIKSPSSSVQHMYLAHNAECVRYDQVDQTIAAGGGLIRYPDAKEAPRQVGKCKEKVALIFDPPRPESRFRAYSSFEEGAKRWMNHHQRIAAKYDNYLDAVNAGDIDKVAQIMANTHYFGGSEPAYADGMKGKRKRIDAQLGPIK